MRQPSEECDPHERSGCARNRPSDSATEIPKQCRIQEPRNWNASQPGEARDISGHLLRRINRPEFDCLATIVATATRRASRTRPSDFLLFSGLHHDMSACGPLASVGQTQSKCPQFMCRQIVGQTQLIDCRTDLVNFCRFYKLRQET
jgi:hypothetical protein